MYIGAHVSAAGGVFNAPENAHRIGCECFQIFTRSPRGGKAPELTDEIVEKYKKDLKKYNLQNVYVHAPYYINFASPNTRIAKGSIEVIRDELERGSRLGVRALMTHLGSAREVGKEKAVKETIAGIKQVLKGYTGSCVLLLENAAGAGAVIGDSIDEIAVIFQGVHKLKSNQGKIGVCLDTCHLFASGADVRTKKDWDSLLKEFDIKIGLKNLYVIHANDSKFDLNEKKDRHENIGNGYIGKAGFEAMVNHPKLKKVDCILETPWVDGEKTIAGDIRLVKKMRDK